MGKMRRHSGQTATEYMLLLSVLVVAVVASAYVFVPEFQGGVAALAQDASVMLATGQVGGIGFSRTGVSNAGSDTNPQPPGGDSSTGSPTGSSNAGANGFGGRIAVGGASFDRAAATAS